MNLKNKNISPIKTNSWIKLQEHFKEIKNISLKNFFLENKNRFDQFNVQFNKLLFDFSKNRINKKTINILSNLAIECKLEEYIYKMFSGEKINETENRSVLHTALRNFDKNKKIFINGVNIMEDIYFTIEKMKIFSEKIRNGIWKGYTNKPIKNIVNVGIGGSHIGPMMVVEALKSYSNKNLNIHFISNIDGSSLYYLFNKIDLDTTIFIISSKTFTTEETITNFKSILNFFIKKTKNKKFIKKHFIATTSNKKEAIKFGIPEKNIFLFGDWVGGRYSVWNAVGLSICLYIGFENFYSFLKGAYEIDLHFKNEKIEKNIPILLALIGIWNINFLKINNHLILPYNQSLQYFILYIQQLEMESNGKSVNRNGIKINYSTCPIIWGGLGNDSQHSFYQFLYQGTISSSFDFIIYIKDKYKELENHNKILFSNFLSQTRSLAFGNQKEEIIQELIIELKKKKYVNFLFPHKIIKGNKPSNSIILEELSPITLGNLMAIYEHKIFVQSIIWNIFAFDQWGVELGKKNSKKILLDLYKKNEINCYDSSTNNLINFYKKIFN
ncbi:glucose-6-phosphate isomerase [Candidatus Shikimatogenerans silvanidophilus]|uniref:glucose-6-phosphate isomerase n=1 Tax=Candidatus Shikimatogenerans silvanidophilus TaxID=2782547 RepID=UPI001BA95EA6|nr:glucose-6-phosphate isomerase [Candidatus Shikimatogenerans silvanidophilus]